MIDQGAAGIISELLVAYPYSDDESFGDGSR